MEFTPPDDHIKAEVLARLGAMNSYSGLENSVLYLLTQGIPIEKVFDILKFVEDHTFVGDFTVSFPVVDTHIHLIPMGIATLDHITLKNVDNWSGFIVCKEQSGEKLELVRYQFNEKEGNTSNIVFNYVPMTVA